MVEPTLKLDSSSYSNMTARVKAIDVPTADTDGATNPKETKWYNTTWKKYYGFYKSCSHLRIAENTKAVWAVGKKYTCDTRTGVILDHIVGWGQDTFRTILKNSVIVFSVGGDSYCEIVWNDDKSILLNLKPLDPATMVHVVDDKGMLIRYEQISKISGEKNKRFDIEDIFHLCNNRVGDNIHGESDVEALEENINSTFECMADCRKLMHRFVKPRFHYIVNSDDPTEIDAFIVKCDYTVDKGENLYTPKDVCERVDVLGVSSNSTLNPLPWLEVLKNGFYQTCSIPQIVLGSASEFSESSAKIAYLSYQQVVSELQSYLEEMIWAQLHLKIKLIFPASLQNEMLSDTAKDGPNAFQQNDTTAGVGQ